MGLLLRANARQNQYPYNGRKTGNVPEGSFLDNDQNEPSSSKHVRDTATHINKILDAKYEKADLPSIVDNITILNNNEKQQLLK